MTPLCRLLALQLAIGIGVAIAVYWLLMLDDSDNEEMLEYPNGESSHVFAPYRASLYGPADMDPSVPSGIHRN